MTGFLRLNFDIKTFKMKQPMRQISRCHETSRVTYISAASCFSSTWTKTSTTSEKPLSEIVFPSSNISDVGPLPGTYPREFAQPPIVPLSDSVAPTEYEMALEEDYLITQGNVVPPLPEPV